MRRLLVPLLGLAAASALAQTDLAAEDYHVYRDAPRLLLAQQRLRFLVRERERRSVRWEALEPLLTGGVALPEPGFALALHYRAAGDEAAGRRAIQWALSPGATDLRQLALVFDWCAPLLGADQDRLARKIEQAMAEPAADLPGQAARALAAIALADRLPDAGNSILRGIVVDWWGGQMVPRLRAGEPAVPRPHLYALLEFMHALRDNTRIDLRASAPEYFDHLPLSYLAAHYPAPLAAPEGQYRIPASLSEGPPDLAAAALWRAAGLALVAFDTNALDHQYLQGWLMLDRFILRSPFGSAYEFLWANPYQPGLSYQTLPEIFHNPVTGEVFARTSWDDDATWVGYFDGRLQMFRDGSVQTLRAGAEVAPLRLGSALIAGAASREAARLRINAPTLFVLGLEPRARYAVEIDDQELALAVTDAGGTLVVTAAEGIDAGVRLRRRP